MATGAPQGIIVILVLILLWPEGCYENNIDVLACKAEYYHQTVEYQKCFELTSVLHERDPFHFKYAHQCIWLLQWNLVIPKIFIFYHTIYGQSILKTEYHNKMSSSNFIHRLAGFPLFLSTLRLLLYMGLCLAHLIANRLDHQACMIPVFLEEGFFRKWKLYYLQPLHLEEALARYKGFLYLIKVNQEKGVNLFRVPTYNVDLMWQTHQPHPVTYCIDMLNLLGRVLENDTDDDRAVEKKLETGFCGATEYFENTFRVRYWKVGAIYCGSLLSPMTSIPQISSSKDTNGFAK